MKVPPWSPDEPRLILQILGHIFPGMQPQWGSS